MPLPASQPRAVPDREAEVQMNQERGSTSAVPSPFSAGIKEIANKIWMDALALVGRISVRAGAFRSLRPVRTPAAITAMLEEAALNAPWDPHTKARLPIDREWPRRKRRSNCAAAIHVTTRTCIIRGVRTGTRRRTPEVVLRIHDIAVEIHHSTIVEIIVAKDIVRSNRAAIADCPGAHVNASKLVADGCIAHKRKVRRINMETVDIGRRDIGPDYQPLMRIK
jgi:hypothetical protein